MQEIKTGAYGKINLTLDVLRKRDDGYHEVKMIMQSVCLCDEITIKKTEGNEITLATDLPYLPSDKRNSAFCAAQKFFEATGIAKTGVFINIKKNVPVAAGLAGGSADAAAVLRGLNQMFDTRLSFDDLRGIAMEVGSDVAFCICGGTALATGRGEIISALPAACNFYVVLCTPAFSIPTPRVYQRLNCKKIKMHPDTEGAICAIKNRQPDELASRIYNVLESGVAAEKKCISEIHSTLIEFGAMGASMSGSGPTVFGLFKDYKLAENAAKELKKQYDNVFLTEFKKEY